MSTDNNGPLAIFGISIKSIIAVVVFFAVLLVIVNWSDISSFLYGDNFIEPITPTRSEQNVEPRDIIVDEEMLSRAMREVETEKLEEMEQGDGSPLTNRFFYIVELVSGGDLEGVDLTIEPDQVILVSEGGTRTTINRSDVKKIHRHKIAPSP